MSSTNCGTSFSGMRSAAGCVRLGHMQLARPWHLHEYHFGGAPAALRRWVRHHVNSLPVRLQAGEPAKLRAAAAAAAAVPALTQPNLQQAGCDDDQRDGERPHGAASGVVAVGGSPKL